MDEITKIETIDQYDQLFGLETLHPLVNVIDFSKATKTVEYYHMNIGFYSLFLKDINCGDLKYGRNYYDYQDGMQCAAFSSAYVLRHFGEAAEGMDIFADFPNRAPDGGIFPEGIVNYFEGKGYQAEFRQNGTVAEIKGLVSQGVPVIVFIHTEEPHKTVHSTHYIPVVGYDEEYLYFAESIQGLANCENEENPVYNRKTELSKFERLWLNIDGVWDNPYFVIAKGDGGLS